MDCDLIKGKLIDYIDGELPKEEMKEIREHLNKCEHCNNQYNELLMTTNYIKDNFRKINDKRLDFKRIKSKNRIRKIKRTGIMAVALSFLLVVTALATDMFDFMKYWKNSSKKATINWESLIDNGMGQKLNITKVDKNIKVTVEGVIADKLNTLILLKVEDLKGKTRFAAPFGADKYESIEIGGDIERLSSQLPPILNYSNLYQENENINKMILKTNPLTKEEGTIKVKIREFMSMINDNKESIIRVKGNWDLEISAKKLKSKEYSIDKKINLDGYELEIKKVTIAPTETDIEYEMRNINPEKKHDLGYITFSMKYKNKVYKHSRLGYSGKVKSFGVSHAKGRSSLETLYLEDPDNIKLIVDRYGYRVKKVRGYKLEPDKLPQKIKYKDSTLTIEDIIYEEDSTEIIIKEDDSDGRKYINSNIYVELGGRPEYEIYSQFLETTESGDLITKQKILIKKEDILKTRKRFEWLDTKENISELLKPEYIYIDGQEYIQYPNKEINIKLEK